MKLTVCDAVLATTNNNMILNISVLRLMISRDVGFGTFEPIIIQDVNDRGTFSYIFKEKDL